MAVTITSLGLAPVLDAAVLVAGGTLAANTTYYVVVVAKNANVSYAVNQATLYTAPSNEISFTTDTINKSASLTWSSVVGATYYEVFITTVSGNYQTNYYTVCNSSTVNTTSYTITGIINGVYHASLLTSPYSGLQSLPLGLNKNSPLIKINISGNETLQSIYNALVVGGYAGNVYYDGLNFAIHGNIVIETGVVGSLTILSTTMWFAHCFFRNFSTSFIFNIGAYNATTKTTSGSCVIHAEFYDLYFTNINIYQTAFQFFRWTGTYSNIGSQINSMHSNVIDCTFDGVRNTNTNWSNNKVTNPVMLRGWSGGNQVNAYFDVPSPTFYTGNSEPDDYTDSILKINTATFAFTMTLSAISGRIANFYDCTFIGAYYNSINELVFNFASFAGLTEEQFRFYYSVQGTIIDPSKNLISDANAKCYDKDNNLIFDTNTVAGSIPKNYVKVMGVIPTGNGTGPSFYTRVFPNPFTLVISKVGYETYTTKFDLLKKFDEIITLKPVIRTRYTFEGKPLRALTPESGSSSKLLEL